MRLSVFAGEPRPVAIAGASRWAAKLRVRDLAGLEAWFAEVAAEAGDDRPDDPAEPWPPTLNSPAGSRLLGTAEGMARVILASLGPHAPGLDLDAARALAGSLAPGEGEALFRAAFPEPPDRKPDPAAPARRPMDWHAAILDLARRYHYTPAECLDMPTDQFFGMFAPPGEATPDGRPRKRWKTPIGSPEEMKRLWDESPINPANAAKAAGPAENDGGDRS